MVTWPSVSNDPIACVNATVFFCFKGYQITHNVTDPINIELWTVLQKTYDEYCIGSTTATEV